MPKVRRLGPGESRSGWVQSCTTCSAVFHVNPHIVEGGRGFKAHQKRCARASPAERVFFRANRRWPEKTT